MRGSISSIIFFLEYFASPAIEHQLRHIKIATCQIIESFKYHKIEELEYRFNEAIIELTEILDRIHIEMRDFANR